MGAGRFTIKYHYYHTTHNHIPEEKVRTLIKTKQNKTKKKRGGATLYVGIYLQHRNTASF